ncbi:MAG: hypothetical protein ACRDB9_10260 [Cetobacterium sp.]
MSFIDELKVVEEISLGNKSLFNSELPGGYRLTEWLNIDSEYNLSIQASEHAYCAPRALIPLDQYTHFEMGLVYNRELTMDTSLFNGFERKEELLERQSGTIYGFVTKDLIEDLYKWLRENR